MPKNRSIRTLYVIIIARIYEELRCHTYGVPGVIQSFSASKV